MEFRKTKNRNCRTFLAVLAMALYGGHELLPAQQSEPRRKPVLIIDDPPKEETPTSEENKAFDPLQADEHISVGDFYFKRENYKAAADRYREAIRLNPKMVPAYEKLVRTLEKQKHFSEAARICGDFVKANPDSKEAVRFQEWQERLSKLEEKRREQKG
ncbi:MAG: hypothetical protein HY645_14440 [Acidobacteria bacterium]|nr:hypothetical protein [Acidobacteriota bacterium]